MTGVAGQMPILVIGAGGHARVLADCLCRLALPVMGFLDTDSTLHGRRIAGFPVIGDDDILRDHLPASVTLVNGVGSVDIPLRRRAVFERLAATGYAFRAVVDAAAFVAGEVALGDGAQIMAGALVQTGARIGANVIVNTGAIVEHDCEIEDHCHIATGARLSGSVHVGAGCHIGAGATVIQGVRIGAGALIAAGAVVVRDVQPGQRVRGVPAQGF
jgi:sugar O-acyltransferase (sialic acid O-acetyltransferase NeuD family)